MINLGEWGAIAGSITAIVSLILLVADCKIKLDN